MRCAAGTACTPRSRAGLTLLDVVVAVAVIGVLIGLLMPIFTDARESAQRLACANNLREIGRGISMFAHERNDAIPGSVFDASTDPSDPRPARFQDAVYLRLTHERSGYRQVWDALGHLIVFSYIPYHETFYCPSHTGEFTFDRFETERRTGRGDIVANYHFRVNDGQRANHLSRLPLNYTLVADSLRSPEEFNHTVGLNLMAADLSARWADDPDGFIISSIATPASSGGAGPPLEEPAESANPHNIWPKLDNPAFISPRD